MPISLCIFPKKGAPALLSKGILTELVGTLRVQATAAFFKKLRPAFKVPSRYQLANTLLMVAFNKVRKAVSKQLEGKPVTITTDGWSRTQGEATLVNFCAHVYGGSIFLDLEVGRGSVTGENLLMSSRSCTIC